MCDTSSVATKIPEQTTRCRAIVLGTTKNEQPAHASNPATLKEKNKGKRKRKRKRKRKTYQYKAIHIKDTSFAAVAHNNVRYAVGMT